jgi:N-acyl-D-aspartate/D-glutamate deacylase
VQRADGYMVTMNCGRITFRAGEPTGEMPGRLVRGAQRAPTAVA